MRSTHASEARKNYVPTVEFSPSTDRVVGGWRDVRDDSAEILFESSLLEALVSSSGMGRDVRSLVLYNQHFLCRSRRGPRSKL